MLLYFSEFPNNRYINFTYFYFQLFLQKFGYLNETNGYRTGAILGPDAISIAIKDFQRFVGLEETGKCEWFLFYIYILWQGETKHVIKNDYIKTIMTILCGCNFTEVTNQKIGVTFEEKDVLYQIIDSTRVKHLLQLYAPRVFNIV